MIHRLGAELRHSPPDLRNLLSSSFFWGGGGPRLIAELCETFSWPPVANQVADVPSIVSRADSAPIDQRLWPRRRAASRRRRCLMLMSGVVSRHPPPHHHQPNQPVPPTQAAVSFRIDCVLQTTQRRHAPIALLSIMQPVP